MNLAVHSTSTGASPLEIVEPGRLGSLGRRELTDALERGKIVYFPVSPVPLPSEDEQQFLRERLPPQLERKNVTWYPAAKRLVGVEEAATRARTLEVLSGHAARVRETLAKLMPDYLHDIDPGLSSFRPLQERGRNLSVHASNERLHVDAGAYGATHGGRILRFFINLHPREERVWLTKGTFNALFEKYRIQTFGEAAIPVKEGPLDRLFSGLIRAVMAAGVPMARVVDSSPYDRAMRMFHNFLKENDAFQTSEEDRVEIAFPPFSAWMVFTDGVSHACTSGQFALVDTFVIPLERSGIPELAPYHVLASTMPGSAQQLLA